MEIIGKCGQPDELQGSGIEIYIYHLEDGSIVVIGTPNLHEKVMYAEQVTPEQKVVDLLN